MLSEGILVMLKNKALKDIDLSFLENCYSNLNKELTKFVKPFVKQFLKQFNFQKGKVASKQMHGQSQQ